MDASTDPNAPVTENPEFSVADDAVHRESLNYPERQSMHQVDEEATIDELSGNIALPDPVQALDQPTAKLIQLDLGFARIGTIAESIRVLLSGIFGSHRTNSSDTTNTKVLDIVDDLLHKVRQQSQYSIHAQPGLGLRKPDDITSDMVENMVAASLGTSVYKLNAFWGPWIGLAKIFFPYSEKPILGLAQRLLNFSDNAIGKLTNMFWNMRRISKAVVLYDGGIPSDALTQRQTEVREVLSHYWDLYIKRPLRGMVRWITRQEESTEDSIAKVRAANDQEKIREIRRGMWSDYWSNFKAIFSKQYKCAHEGGILKDVGFEEPENKKWYVRMKIASKWLGLPIGVAGAALNSLGIGLNFIGSVFNSHNIRKASDTLTDYANAFMSLIYLTGEVPANLNEYLRKKKFMPDKVDAYKNLLVFGTGILGMLNRLKMAPVFGSILNALKIKPILDYLHLPLEHFFLLFFSYNRLVYHRDDKEDALKESSARDHAEANKHENIRSHLALPLRVLFHDPDVSYTHELDESAQYSQAA